MGRKLDLGQLTEEEEKVILQVIQRDFTVRKVESNRIGQLSKDVEEEEQKQKEVVKEAVKGEVPINSLCAKCGSKFMWLINPKSQCKGCDLYFCKNKIDCIVYDKITKECFCNACLKQRELHFYAGDWFYEKLKGKFRRHGGAKVSRELQKKKKRKSSESDSSQAPAKPPRVGLETSNFGSPPSSVSTTPASVRRQPSDASQSGISQSSKEEIKGRMDSQEMRIEEEYNESLDVVVIETHLESAPPLSTSDIEIQTDNLESIDDKLPEIKEELESAISRILLPKLEELKRSQIEHQTEVDRQQKVEDAVRLAGEMIDKAFERALENHAQRPEENVILEKYLIDSKTELLNKVSTQLHDETAFQPSSANSSLRESTSLREAGTMTETSDSEMSEALSSASGRKKSPNSLPLSERLGNLSPDSLRRSIEQNQTSLHFTQGVVLQKDQLVARAELGIALEQILDAQGVPVNGPNSPQEFSTELKFTAVGGGKRRFQSGEVSDSTSSSDDTDRQEEDDILANSENWSTPELMKRPVQFGKKFQTSNTIGTTSMVSLQNDGKSPYDGLGSDGSDSDSKEHVQEEQVLASLVRRPDGPTSPQALMSPHVEVFDSLPEKKPRLPVDVAVNPAILESMSKDLNQKNGGARKVEPEFTSPPVVEDLVFAVDKTAVESQVPVEEETGMIYQDQPQVKLSSRNSSDSAYWSDYAAFAPGSPSSESELSAIPEASQEERYEHDSSSDSDESDASSAKSSSRRNRNSFLQPQRLSHVSHEQKIPANQLSYDDDLLADRDDFGDRFAEILAQKQREQQQNVPEGPPFNVRESVSSSSDEESSKKKDVESSSSSDEEESLTPLPEERSPGIEESAVGLRIVNGKSLEVVVDALERIEDAKIGNGSESNSSKSSKTCSVHDEAEEIHKLNEAEETIYKNAAETYAMEERLDQMERTASGLNRSDPGLKQMLYDLDAEIEKAESQVEEIKHGGKSIDLIMQELQGAGLQVERGGFKRTSLDSLTSPRTQEDKIQPGRHSLPAVTKLLHPVNAPDTERPSWHKNTFTVIPGARSVPIEEPQLHSTPKQTKLSSSSESSHSSGTSTPNSPRTSIMKQKSFHQKNAEPTELEVTIAHILRRSQTSEALSLPPKRECSKDNGILLSQGRAIISPRLKSPSESSDSSGSERSHSLNDENILKTAMRHFSQEEALAQIRPSSANPSHSSHSSASFHHMEETMGALEQQRPSSAHSSHSSHSKASSHIVEETFEVKVAGSIIPAATKPRPSSAHSSHSSHSRGSSQHDKETIGEETGAKFIPPPVRPRPSSAHSSHSSHSAASSHHVEETIDVKTVKEVEADLPESMKSPSHSSASGHFSIQQEAKGEVELGVTIPASLKSPSTHSMHSSHSSSSVHSEDRASTLSLKSPSVKSARSSPSDDDLANVKVASVSERKKIFENGGAPTEVKSSSSHSIHSSTSSRSSDQHSVKGDWRTVLKSNKNNSGQVQDSVVPPVQQSVSSHSATSLQSATTTSSEVHSDVEEELGRISYKAGLSAEELEEARVPTPVPRTKKETILIEETIVLPAPAPRERKHSETSDHHETAEEVLLAKGVFEVKDQFEKKKSSSSSSSKSSESGTAYIEPLIKEGMQAETLNAHERNLELEEQRKKKIMKRRKPSPRQQISSDSESSDANEIKKGKRKSKVMADDSWMKAGKKDSDDEAEEHASRLSVGTSQSSRSGRFHNLSAAEQREMARIALLHCEETAIAEDRFQTKTVKFVRELEEKPAQPLPVQKEVAPMPQVSPSIPESVVQKQKEILPTLAPHDIRTVAEVHVERSSSTSSGSSTESAKNLPIIQTVAPAPSPSSQQGNLRRSTFNTDLETAKVGQSYNVNASNNLGRNSRSQNTLHVMESPADLDRGQNVRGSITMRGGKMVMTSSPDSKLEFQEPPN